VPATLVVMRSDIAALLAGTELFADVGDEAHESLARAAIVRRFGKGEIIFHQGDVGDAMYVVAAGAVKIFVTSEDGDEMLLITLGPGDVFGELALLDGGPRSASTEALEPTELVAITRRTVLALLPRHPRLGDSLFRALGAVVRRLTEQASDLVFLDLHGRVAKLIVSFADRGRPAHGGIVLEPNLTQADLAAMVGGSRQSVNQILRSFERRGDLELRGRQMIVRDLEALRRRASGAL
jgi:CRP/FNR family cyclic AMP-dependent transcriptional regulator